MIKDDKTLSYSLNYISQSTITIQDILDFLSYYNFVGKIEFRSKEKLKFDDTIQFLTNNDLKRFEILLELHLLSAINLNILGQESNEFGNRNKELDKKLGKHYYKNNSFITESLGLKKEGFSTQHIAYGKKAIIEKIKTKDCISFEIEIIGRGFFTLLFSLLHKSGYENIDVKNISKKLYDDILEQTNGRNKYYDKIAIFYSFSNDYLKNKGLILPLLTELERKNYLKLKNIEINLEDDLIIFYINQIVDITENSILKLGLLVVGENNIGEIEYKKNGVYISGNKFLLDKKAIKAQCFLHLIGKYFCENPNEKKVSIYTLWDYYEMNKEIILSGIDTKNNPKFLKLGDDNIREGHLVTISRKAKKLFGKTFLEMKGTDIIRKEMT